MIGFPCQALTNTPTSYGIPSHAAEDVAPCAFFPVKLLIWKQTQCILWRLEAEAGLFLGGAVLSGATGKGKKDTREAFVQDLSLIPSDSNSPKRNETWLWHFNCSVFPSWDKLPFLASFFQWNTVPLMMSLIFTGKRINRDTLILDLTSCLAHLTTELSYWLQTTCRPFRI